MGAIQQAFNQALTVGTFIANPAIQSAKAKRAEKKDIQKTEVAAEEALGRMEEAFGAKEGTYSEQQLGDIVKEAYEAQEASYAKRPTLQKGALKAELYESAREWEAADAVSKYRQMSKDQKANIEKVKGGAK